MRRDLGCKYDKVSKGSGQKFLEGKFVVGDPTHGMTFFDCAMGYVDGRHVDAVDEDSLEWFQLLVGWLSHSSKWDSYHVLQAG